MVEHDPCSVFSWDFFSGSEDGATSPPGLVPLFPVPCGKQGCKSERPPNTKVLDGNGSRGSSSVFLPIFSEAVRMQLLRKERLHFDGAGRWFKANPPRKRAVAQSQNLCSAFSSDSISRAVMARLLLVTHASAVVQTHNPRSAFSLVSILRAVSSQLLRTDLSAVQIRLRFRA